VDTDCEQAYLRASGRAQAYQSFTGTSWSLTLSMDPSALQPFVSVEENVDIKPGAGFSSGA
jgi:hypothetical protein